MHATAFNLNACVPLEPLAEVIGSAKWLDCPPNRGPVGSVPIFGSDDALVAQLGRKNTPAHRVVPALVAGGGEGFEPGRFVGALGISATPRARQKGFENQGEIGWVARGRWG